VTLLRQTYSLLLNTVGYGTLPFLRSKAKGDPVFRNGRLGRFEVQSPESGSPRIWFHAVSVGEVTGAIPTLNALTNELPNSRVFLTAATQQGFRFACAQTSDRAVVLPFPMEFEPALQRAFQFIRPDLYVAFESEFWPNLFRVLERNRVPAILLNGRLSDRSANWYGRFGPLFRPIFEQFSWLAMLDRPDVENALKLGARPDRTMALGSSKYDWLTTRVQPHKILSWRKILDIPSEVPVVVGGSLRRSECTELPGIFRALNEIRPDCIGIFAPRHIDQVPNMAQYLNNNNIPFHLLTHLEQSMEPRRHSVVIVDRMGALFDLYGLGDLVFCGGTLEPVGGHNILEPAAWSKPVFYGPHIEKVYNEHSTLQATQGSFQVRDADELLRRWCYWISRPQELKPYGENAKLALGRFQGVSERQVELIMRTLAENSVDNPAVHK
jgi:3-deoxy-D-manno-octulosonic-acid transferase